MGAETRQAAVAIVIAGSSGGDEVLLVRRATFAGDPWSGHIALPGGGVEPGDISLEATARRETLEETGIDLASSKCIATLSLVTPRVMRAPSVSVAPFVFRYAGNKYVTMSPEIAEAWWVPVTELCRVDAWRPTTVKVHDGFKTDVRAFQLHGHPLWGLTERILDEFLRLWPM